MDQQNTPPSRQVVYSDEIDLFELWAVLVKKKWLICTISMLFITVSLVIAYTVKPVYKASVHFLPPLKSDVAALNVEGVGATYSPDQLYSEFQRNFRSRSSLWRFFVEKKLYLGYLSEPYDEVDINHVFESKFVKTLSLVRPNPKKSDAAFVSASFQWHDKKEVAGIINSYVDQVDAEMSARFVSEVEGLASFKAESLRQEIEVLRNISEGNRVRKLERLSESILIAKKLEIKRGEPLLSWMESYGEQPFYLSGYEVLEAERLAILNRKSMDPFIDGLEEKLQKLAYLDSIPLPKKVKSVRVSRYGATPKGSFSPKRVFLIIFGVVVGAIFGVGAALFVNMFERRAK